MSVTNIHERGLDSTPERVGALIESLSSRADALWPHRSWPRMKFDRPLGVDATGGHGPVRYFVEEYVPGRSVRFRFTGPKGFDGFHEFEMTRAASGKPLLRHELRMKTRGRARLSWPLVFRPMHDALLDDCLATAQASLGLPPDVRPWSLRVRFLRWVVTRGKARPQMVPGARSEE